MAKNQQSQQEKMVKVSRDKSAKFVELAQKRVTRVLAQLEGVKALANRRSYTYTPDQVSKIGTALAASFKSTMDAFNTTPDAKQEGFKL